MTGSTYLQTRSQRKPWGLGVVVLMHLLAFWAIQAGLARDIGRQLPQVVQAILLQETLPPPPPPKIDTPPAPLPPPPQPTPPQPQPPPPVAPAPPVAAPSPTPPAQVPPVEVAVASSTTPKQAITAVANNAPQPTPASAAAPAAPAAPSTTAKAKSEPVRTGPIGIYCEKPSFPTISRRMEEEGSVTLNIFVNVDGNVSKINIEKSSGFKRLDEAAKNESMRWRFKPATLDGKPVEHSFTKTFNFKLDSDSISNQSPKEKDNPPC
jgi:protein TonB